MNAQFKDLLTKYDAVDTAHAETKDRLARLEMQRKALRDLLSTEVQNIGLGKGTQLQVPSVGKFHFTTKRWYNLPAERRADFVKLLIQRNEEQLLTIAQAALNAWCDDMVAREEELPPYLTFHEDKFIPSISLDSARARKAAKRKEKQQGGNNG